VLSGLGAEVILACRNPAKAQAVIGELEAQNPKAKLRLEQVDVSDLASMRAFAARLTASTPKLDILLNNAGGWVMNRRTTVDGFEEQWATNVLGPHLLTRLLAPALHGGGRIVNVASTAAGGLELADAQWERRKYNGVSAYSATKQALRMLSWAWAERLATQGVTVNAMSPGLINTELNRNASGFFGAVFTLTKLFAKTPAQGADTAAWLAAAPELAGTTNQFWEKRKSVVCKFRNVEQERVLFELCESQVNGRLGSARAA
jgi:NAD(P)-dependent dehydrogenase (short-subunit alcohol dehydrogenase family)